ncbi:helix-turn-helix transcriptional regulator [Hymenobacter sp. HSC-4F20]|uniref:S24 family peptidase n=1 Tax=Hymenobacter sp. HSC-4F20 TaxID=2864135 RepID=UPI0038F67157
MHFLHSKGINLNFLFTSGPPQEPLLAAAPVSSEPSLAPQPEPVPETSARLAAAGEFLVVTQNTEGLATIPLINYKAAANYLAGYQSQEFFEQSSPMILPSEIVRQGHMRGVQVVGDSMETTYHDGDWLVCRYLERFDWESLTDLECYVVVTESRGLQIKRVKNRLRRDGFLRLRSDNRTHPPFNVYYDDILEIWHVEAQITKYMPNRNEQLFHKVDNVEEGLHDLRELYEQMKEENQELRQFLQTLVRQVAPSQLPSTPPEAQ